MSDAASDRLPRGPERRGAVGRTGAVVDAGRRETTRGTYTRNGNLGSDVSVILKETFDMITGDGRSCATRAILEVPSPGSARGPEYLRVFGAIWNAGLFHTIWNARRFAHGKYAFAYRCNAYRR